MPTEPNPITVFQVVHLAVEVCDPGGDDADLADLLVRFEDAGGNAMAELIIGKEVEGRAGQRFVRLPEKKRTYTTDIEKVPSTSFADWIETELLGISSFDIGSPIDRRYAW